MVEMAMKETAMIQKPMNSCIQAHQNWSKVGLVSCNAQCILVGDDSAICRGVAIAFVAPFDGPAPFFGLIEPEASCIEADVPAYGS